MKPEQDILILESLDLAVGEYKRIQCPVCRAKDEKSLKLTRTESGISWVCFRGTCPGCRGYTGGPPSGATLTKKKYPGLRRFERPTAGLSTSQRRYIQNRYGLSAYEIRQNGFLRQLDQPRLVMPIFDAVEDTVGYVSKKISPCLGPKSMTYWHKERPNIHYPRSDLYDGPVAILEDTLSSVRVARYTRSRALLGTFLGDTEIEQLKQETDHLILALDNDMVSKMVKYAKKLRGLFHVDIVIWPKDPKDLPDETVREYIGKYL